MCCGLILWITLVRVVDYVCIVYKLPLSATLLCTTLWIAGITFRMVDQLKNDSLKEIHIINSQAYDQADLFPESYLLMYRPKSETLENQNNGVWFHKVENKAQAIYQHIKILVF